MRPVATLLTILLFAGIGVGGACLIVPEQVAAIIGTTKEVVLWIGSHIAQIIFVISVIGMFYSAFLKRNPMRFCLFAVSLVATYVLGW